MGDLNFEKTGSYFAKSIEGLSALEPYQEPFDLSVMSSDNWTSYAYAVAKCPACQIPSLILYKAGNDVSNAIHKVVNGENVPVGNAQIEVLRLWPAISERSASNYIPSKIGELFVDAQGMLDDGRSPAIIIATCRAVMEASLNHMGAKGNNLQNKIDDLGQKGVLTQALVSWSHRIRLDGNVALHEIDGTKEVAEELVEFIEFFLHFCFVLPAQIEIKMQGKN